MDIEKPIGITQSQINQLYSTPQRYCSELPETFTDKEYNMKKMMEMKPTENRDERFFNKLYELYEASQIHKPSNSEVNNRDEMNNNNPGTITTTTTPRAELDTVTFTFIQETNCVDGPSNDIETLTVEAKSSIGIDNDGGAFYVLKTKQWSIDGANEISEILKRCEKAIEAMINK